LVKARTRQKLHCQVPFKGVEGRVRKKIPNKELRPRGEGAGRDKKFGSDCGISSVFLKSEKSLKKKIQEK